MASNDILRVCAKCEKIYDEPDYRQEPIWNLTHTQIVDEEDVEICPYCSSKWGHEEAAKLDFNNIAEYLLGVKYEALKNLWRKGR